MTARDLQIAALNLQVATVDQTEAARVLVTQIDWFIAERTAFAQTLADFYNSPLSMSSVAPILRLAEMLNPSLQQPRRHQHADTYIAPCAELPMEPKPQRSAMPCGCDLGAGRCALLVPSTVMAIQAGGDDDCC